MSDFATFGPAHLDVTDRGRSLAFWRDDIGLEVRDEDAETVSLGTSDATLLVLHPGASVANTGRHAGLYHVAIHPPDEAEFAALLDHLVERKVPIRPVDHTFSKAIYLSDPDGLGLELTLETPERGTEVSVDPGGLSILDAGGRRLSLAEPLDLREVLAHLPERDGEFRLAPGTKIGHMHLRVTDVEPASRFYRERLGFIEHFGIPGLVANLHAGGAFPHRLAMNTFDGGGLTLPPEGMARLRRTTLHFINPADLYERLGALPEAAEHPEGWLIHDPTGNALVLTA